MSDFILLHFTLGTFNKLLTKISHSHKKQSIFTHGFTERDFHIISYITLVCQKEC